MCQDSFLGEARDVLRAGLSSAAWITVDDTGARHKARNGFCTQMGNAHFAWFGTTASKSRLNVLALLRAGHRDYVINDEALAYMREHVLAAQSSLVWSSIQTAASPVIRLGTLTSNSSASRRSRSIRIP